jgi:hypothetical protein
VAIAPAAVPAALAALPDAVVIGEVVDAASLGSRYAEGSLEVEVPGLELVAQS